MKVRFFLLLILISISAFAAGCSLIEGSIVGPTDTATVIAKTAQIRTGYAVVASDLLEVKRGDTLDILDQVESPDVKGLIWYRVRAHDDVQTEGWIEAQNVITSGTLQKSKDLAAQFGTNAVSTFEIAGRHEKKLRRTISLLPSGEKVPRRGG